MPDETENETENENENETEDAAESDAETAAEAEAEVVHEGADESETEEAVAEPGDEPDAAAEPDAALAAEAETAVVAKRKKKRVPRSERPQRPKKKRAQVADRKPITRLPKPERVRGRRQERQGTVVSAAADKTIVVRVDVVKVHPTYKKVIKRSTKLHAHDERNEAKLGDVVRIVETRPLSRMKRWRLQEIVEAAK